MHKINQLVWCKKDYKQIVRNVAIEAYRQVYRNKLRPNQQYWSLCGQCTDKNGNASDRSEIGQVLAAKLIVSEQFFGIDLNPDIISANQKAYPDSTWICAELYQGLAHADVFNPAIINIDSTSTPQRSCLLAAAVLEMVEESGVKESMVIVNSVMEYMGMESHHSTNEEVQTILEASPIFRKAWSTGNWYIFGQSSFDYRPPTTNTTMSTLIFCKNNK